MARGWHLTFDQKIDRFLANIQITEGCWVWEGFINECGYGRYKWLGRNTLAHRVMWRVFLGDFDARLKVCHTCDNRRCVRPSHLFLGTQPENIADMITKGRQRGALGAQNCNAKLTPDAVRLIRHYYQQGLTQEEIAASFGVVHTAIGSILRHQTWTHVT